VFDNDRGSSLGDPLGGFLVSASRIDPDGFNGELILQGNGAMEHSMLSVIVDIF